MRLKSKCIVILATTAMALVSSALGDVRVPVAGYRLHRLYFDVGEEAHVYDYSRFVVYRGTDSLYAGRIAHAWRGVAVTGSTGVFFDTLNIDSLDAVIETAGFDTLSTIIVGTDLIGLELWADGYRGGRARIREYQNGQAMLEDFYADLLDGLLTFRDLSPRPEGVTTISERAPFMVVMIPNVGMEMNYQGQLTTSLYYRFDRAHLTSGFDGDGLTIPTCFDVDTSTFTVPARWFAYNPQRGRQLFEQMTNRPATVAFYSGDRTLDNLTHYFADIVSRDRCAVELTDDRRAADVRLVYVPVSWSLPSTTVHALYYEMVSDSVPGLAANEHLRRIAAEFRYMTGSSGPEDYVRSLRRVSRIMIEDLGVFPLLRPTVFAHSHRRLQGLRFNDQFQLDLAAGRLMALPQPPEEDTP